MAEKTAEYELEIEDKKCRLSKMSRATLELVLGMITGTGIKAEMIRAGEVILRNCWVDGGQEILDQEDLLIGAALKAYDLIEIKEASLKKL